jgi:hypothetical protein
MGTRRKRLGGGNRVGQSLRAGPRDAVPHRPKPGLPPHLLEADPATRKRSKERASGSLCRLAAHGRASPIVRQGEENVGPVFHAGHIAAVRGRSRSPTSRRRPLDFVGLEVLPVDAVACIRLGGVAVVHCEKYTYKELSGFVVREAGCRAVERGGEESADGGASTMGLT